MEALQGAAAHPQDPEAQRDHAGGEHKREDEGPADGEVALIGAELDRLLGLDEQQTLDLVSTATGMAGTLWQMATPGPRLRELYTTDPRLGHAVVEVEPRLRRILTAFLTGTRA